jgi:hypothetical protein
MFSADLDGDFQATWFDQRSSEAGFDSKGSTWREAGILAQGKVTIGV